MSETVTPASFEEVTPLAADSPTLIEGLPGHGLVAAIAVDQITEQLELDHYGNIASAAFPPVVTFENGLVQDLVRVYAGSDPEVMTLESDLALPEKAFEPLSQCILEELADEFRRAIFLAGAPAESEQQVGDVTAVATEDSLLEDLESAAVSVADEPGVVGGVTGSLVRECYHADVPAVLLIVRSHPFLPDPKAAKAVIENAIEPLVEFDIDTTVLDRKADDIQRRMQQVAKQHREMAERERPDPEQSQVTGMFQ